MKSIRILVLLSCCFVFVGCEDIFDCVIGRRASIPDKTFPIGTINYYYYVELTAEIKNEPRDNEYNYFYELEASDLPAGMSYFINNRVLSIEGTPIETGVFEIEVYLYVDGPERVTYDDDGDARYSDPICTNSITKTYTLIIE